MMRDGRVSVARGQLCCSDREPPVQPGYVESDLSMHVANLPPTPLDLDQLSRDLLPQIRAS